MAVSLVEQQVWTFSGKDVVLVKLRIQTESTKCEFGQDGTIPIAGEAVGTGYIPMHEAACSILVNPFHPVLTIVYKVRVWSTFHPVGVLNHIICVEVSAMVAISQEHQGHFPDNFLTVP